MIHLPLMTAKTGKAKLVGLKVHQDHLKKRHMLLANVNFLHKVTETRGTTTPNREEWHTF